MPHFPWPDPEYRNLTEFDPTFVDTHLASDRQIAALGVDGKFEPAIQVAGGKVAVGFVPGDAFDHRMMKLVPSSFELCGSGCSMFGREKGNAEDSL